MKKKLLICGATGFIGRNILEYFVKYFEYEIHAVSFKSEKYIVPGVTWHKVDLRDAAQVDKLVQGKDIIIQAAATTSGAKDIVNQPHIHVTDNAIMNSLLFRSAFIHKVQHVIFFSCTVMYQSGMNALKETDFDSNQELHPRYFGVGHTKLYLEKMCEFFSKLGNTKFTAIRHSNIYGPYDKFDLERSHVFGATVTKIMAADNKIKVWGTGEEARDLLYIEDLCCFVSQAIKNQEKKYCLYNCGYGKAITIKDLVQKIIKASGKNLVIEYDLSKPTIKTNLCLNCNLAKVDLGWSPSIDLELGINKTLQWWKQNYALEVI